LTLDRKHRGKITNLGEEDKEKKKVSGKQDCLNAHGSLSPPNARE
jgi:hypothetical protein